MAFVVKDLTDLADQAHRNGITELPFSLYRPGQHKGQRWRHSTLKPLDHDCFRSPRPRYLRTALMVLS